MLSELFWGHKPTLPAKDAPLHRRLFRGFRAEMESSGGSDFALLSDHLFYLVHQIAVSGNMLIEPGLCLSEQIQEVININGLEQIMVETGDPDGLPNGAAAVPRDRHQQRLAERLFAAD